MEQRSTLRIRLWFRPVIILASIGISSIWYAAIIQADGAGWLVPRFAPIQPYIWPIVALLLLSLLLGFFIGFLLLRGLPKLVAIPGLIALYLGWICFLAHITQSGLPLGIPDWFSICALIFSGGFFSLGYALPVLKPKARPIWPLLVVPALVASITAIRSGNIGAIVTVALLSLLSIAIGAVCLRKLSRDLDASASLCGALGLALLINLFRLLGGLGYVNSVSILSTLAIIGVLVGPELVVTARQILNRIYVPRTFHTSEWFILGNSVSLALVYWFSSLAPETGSDAIGARSALPIIWERAGKITAVKEIFSSYMGIGGEILNLIALPLSGGSMAKITTLISAGFLACGIASAAPARGRLLPWLASFAFFSSTVVAWQFIHGFVDMPVAFLAIASLLAFVRWLFDRKNAWLLVSGVIVGSAVAIKLNAGTMLLLLAGMVLYECGAHRGKIIASGKPLLFLLVGITASLAPSVWRSYILTGNPVFPFANAIFKSPLAYEDLSKRLASYGSGFSAQVFTLPFRTILSPNSFNELGTYHPAYWLLGLVSICLIPWSPPSAKRWWLASAIFWIGWILTEQNLRYSIPALAFTSIAIASTAREFDPKWSPFSWIAVAVMTLGTLIGFARPTAWIWSETAGPSLPSKFLFGDQSADQFLSIYLPSSALARDINATYGSTAVIWEVPFIRDHQSFIGTTISHPHGALALLQPLYSILPDQPAGTSDESIYRVLKANGITHVMWDNLSPWIRSLPESAWTGIFSTHFSERFLHLESASGHNGFVRLYRVLAENELPQAPIVPKAEPWSGKEIKVLANNLIGVQANWSAALIPCGFFDMIWWSADRRMIYFERVPLDFKSTTGWHRRWHTVPLGATALQVSMPPELTMVKLAIVRQGEEQ